MAVATAVAVVIIVVVVNNVAEKNTHKIVNTTNLFHSLMLVHCYSTRSIFMAHGFLNNFYPFILGERKLRRIEKKQLNRFLIHSALRVIVACLFVHTFFLSFLLVGVRAHFFRSFIRFLFFFSHSVSIFCCRFFADKFSWLPIFFAYAAYTDFVAKMKNNSL